MAELKTMMRWMMEGIRELKKRQQITREGLKAMRKKRTEQREKVKNIEKEKINNNLIIIDLEMVCVDKESLKEGDTSFTKGHLGIDRCTTTKRFRDSKGFLRNIDSGWEGLGDGTGRSNW